MTEEKNKYLKFVEEIIIDESTKPSAYISTENSIYERILNNIFNNIYGENEKSFADAIRKVVNKYKFGIRNIDSYYLTVINEIIRNYLADFIKYDVHECLDPYEIVECVKMVKTYPEWDKDERFLEMKIVIDDNEFIKKFNAKYHPQNRYFEYFFVGSENTLNFGQVGCYKRPGWADFYKLLKDGKFESSIDDFKKYSINMGKTYELINEGIKNLNNKIYG